MIYERPAVRHGRCGPVGRHDAALSGRAALPFAARPDGSVRPCAWSCDDDSAVATPSGTGGAGAAA